VEPGVGETMPLAVDNPREVGADRITMCVGAVEHYGPPLIVVDLGTTTRFDCVNAAGEFIGGAIAPGIAISTEALVARAARLFRVELVRPKEAIGRNTVTNIQSGVVYGYAGLVDGLVDRMKAEMAGSPKVIATGGNASLIAGVARSIDEVNEDLGLEGLRILWTRARER
jgi:type III pantothenate kinase